jgi:hypothetical protein
MSGSDASEMGGPNDSELGGPDPPELGCADSDASELPKANSRRRARSFISLMRSFSSVGEGTA